MQRLEQDVERLVHEHQKLVQLQVSRYLKRYYVGGMEREDLVSWGLIGLVQAARAWDPARSGSFSTLACKAIERMIIRGVRREWKPEQAGATLSLDEITSSEQQAGPRQRFGERLTAEQDVEGELLDREINGAVRSAVAKLPAPYRRLIERHYYQDVPVALLAEELGVSRQGIYMRQRQALRRLRAALSATLAEGAP